MFRDFHTLKSIEVARPKSGRIAQTVHWAKTKDLGFTESVVAELLVDYIFTYFKFFKFTYFYDF
jgi:hypothetical protein